MSFNVPISNLVFEEHFGNKVAGKESFKSKQQITRFKFKKSLII